MIVPSMNHEEMYKELIKGYKALQNKIASKGAKLRRYAIKNGAALTSFDYTDPYRNKWSVQLLFNKNMVATIPFLYYKDEHDRLAALVLNTDTLECQSYTSHFFQRFNERLDLNLKNTLEKMKVYFMMAHESNIHENQDCSFQAELSTGVGFGYRACKFWMQFKTFISHDMLKGQQKLLSDELRSSFADPDLTGGIFQLANAS